MEDKGGTNCGKDKEWMDAKIPQQLRVVRQSAAKTSIQTI
jgi:hypothetical protein